MKRISTMSKWQRFVYFLLVSTGLFFLARYFFWWAQPSHIPQNWPYSYMHELDLIIFAALTFAVFIGSVNRLGIWFTLWFMAKPIFQQAKKGYKVAFLTCFVPGKEPLDMLEDTLRAMKKVRYPHDTWVLDEGDDEDVKWLCKRLEVKHFSRNGIAKYNRPQGKYRAKTKAGNHNAWLNKYEDKYDIVAQIDMDHVPQPDYFEKTLGYFEDKKVAFVGMPQYYKNTRNWIAKGAAEQAYFFNGPIQQGYYGCDMPFLIGTSHIYRTKAMRQIKGYAPTIVEDHLTGMLFYKNGWKGVFVPEILAKGDGPTNWLEYFNQQMRWSYGLFEILFEYTPRILGRLSWKKKINYFSAQLYYFTGLGVFIGMALTFLYLVFGVYAASMNLWQWLFYAFPPFILANLIHIYVHRFTINPKKEPIFGFFGMFLNIGANLIYAQAFLKYITGRKLQYMVTKKGSAVEDSFLPIKSFISHLTAGSLMAYAFVISVLLKDFAIQLQLWALFSSLTLFTVALSSYIYNWYRQSIYNINISNYFKYGLVTVLSLLIFFLFSGRNKVLGFMSQNKIFVSKQKQVNSTESFLRTCFEGALLGISLADFNDQNNLNHLEKTLNKEFAIVEYYQAWGGKDNMFNADKARYLSGQGGVPLIAWEPWKPVIGYDREEEEVRQPDYQLDKIIQGDFDFYILKYAQTIKDYEELIMIRFAHEMNGNWYSWGSTFNKPSQYIKAWRRVHDLFESVGATNVVWVWSPNEIYDEVKVPYADDINVFYPGDQYVDWVGMSSFNWAGKYKQNMWRDPEAMFTETLTDLKKFNKPILIAETASSEVDDKPLMKADWIKKLASYIKDNPEIKGIVWFNTNDNGIDWSINTSKFSVDSFKQYFGDNYFLSSTVRNSIYSSNIYQKTLQTFAWQD